MSMRALAGALLLALASTALGADKPQQPAPPPPPAAPPTAPAPAQAPPPAGPAVEVQETHGDWRVVCASQNSQKVCVASQQLSDKASGQRVLGVELRAATADRFSVTIVMPFGVAVDKPVTIRIDDGTSMTVPFKTCVQVGCVVITTWESPFVAALRKGTALFINALAADNGRDVAFRVSLNGFGTALDRSIALSHP